MIIIFVVVAEHIIQWYYNISFSNKLFKIYCLWLRGWVTHTNC